MKVIKIIGEIGWEVLPHNIDRALSLANGEDVEFDSGLTEMAWLSSGCWCIKRSAVKKMIDAYPELTYDGDDNATGKKIHGLYIPMLYDMKEGDFPGCKPPFKKYLSEDWSFCQRWREIGGKIHADSSIVLKHLGKVPYTLWDVEVVKREDLPPVHPPQPGFDLEKEK